MEDTIVPRLEAAGADLDRVHSIRLARDDKGHLMPLTIPDGLDQIEAVIKRTAAVLTVFDPITAYLSESINSNNDASVRTALTPLADIAQRYGAAMLLIRHLNKNGQLQAMYRGGGSIAFSGAARSALVVDRHPHEPDTRVLAQVKNNLSISKPSTRYWLDSWEKDSTIPVVTWGDDLEMTADQLLKRDGRMEAPERDEAKAFLREVLRAGPMASTEVFQQAKEAGISVATLRRAKKEIYVVAKSENSEKGQKLKWMWELPPTLRLIRGEEE